MVDYPLNSELFQKSLFECKSEEVQHDMSSKEFRRKATFSELGYTCLQMALIWGYQQEVLTILKKEPEVHGYGNALGQALYDIAVRTDSNQVKQYLEREFNYQRRQAHKSEKKKGRNTELLKVMTEQSEFPEEAKELQRSNILEKSIDLMITNNPLVKIEVEPESLTLDREDSNTLFKISEPQEENLSFHDLKNNQLKNMEELNRRTASLFKDPRGDDDQSMLESPLRGRVFVNRKLLAPAKTTIGKMTSNQREGSNQAQETKEELLVYSEKGFSSGGQA